LFSVLKYENRRLILDGTVGEADLKI